MSEETPPPDPPKDQNDNAVFKKPYPPGIYKRRTFSKEPRLPKNVTKTQNTHNNDPYELLKKAHSVQADESPAKRMKKEECMFTLMKYVIPFEIDEGMADSLRNMAFGFKNLFDGHDDDQPGPSNRATKSRTFQEMLPELKAKEMEEDPYEVEEEDDDDSEEEDFEEMEEEEDVDSDGEPDEEVMAVVRNLTKQCKTDTLAETVEETSSEPTGISSLTIEDGNDVDMDSPTQCVQPTSDIQMSNEEIVKSATQPVTIRYCELMRYSYQLVFHDDSNPYQLEKDTEIMDINRILEENNGKPIVEFSSEPRYARLAQNILKNMEVTSINPDDPNPEVKTRLVLIKKMIPYENETNLFVRLVPRDPRIEPPIIEEVIETTYGITEKHARADKYPPRWSYSMVEYAEDRFWTERIVNVPEGLRIPPRPKDYFHTRDSTPPPVDFDFVPPRGSPPIHIPPEAWRLFEERKREHYQQLEEKAKNEEQNDEESK